MPPPPAEPFASRIFLGPALRTQPDRRLVKLVREGYEAAFEEIVRRYRRPLDRFAATIVGNRSEDVTQDAFSKALPALRGSEAEIELRPWLYRIVRNTALNDLRDAPPVAEQLGEAVVGGRSAAVEAERREEVAELMSRLRELPEPQRAAIVMRELEGLSHEEIAAALGVSGGAARQAIYRARVTLRDGLGLLLPLPLLRLLFDHGAEAAAAGGAAMAAGAASSAGGGAATLGGLGAGGALKAGVATALVAGSVGAGVAVQQDRDGGGPEQAAASASQASGGSERGESGGSSGSRGSEGGDSGAASLSHGRGGRGGSSHGGDHRGEGGDDRRGLGGAADRDDHSDDSTGHGRGRSGGDDSPGDDEIRSGRSGHSGSDVSGEYFGEGTSGGSNSGPSGGDDEEGGDGSGSGSGSSGGSTATLSPPPPTDLSGDDSGSGDGDSGEDFDSSGSGSDAG